MLGNLICVCIFGDNFEKAAEIIMKLKKNQNEIVGVPNNQTIVQFLNYCIENNNFNELLVSFVNIKTEKLFLSLYIIIKY